VIGAEAVVAAQLVQGRALAMFFAQNVRL